MAYQPQWDRVRDVVLGVAAQVRADRTDLWDRLSAKDPAFIVEVVRRLRAQGIDAAANGKRGNVRDLSSDVVAFPNPTGCRDATGVQPGLELRDIINSVEDPVARKLVWGDSTQETIDANVGGAWVLPDGATPPPPPPPPPPPAEDAIGRALRQINEMYPVIMGLKRYV